VKLHFRAHKGFVRADVQVYGNSFLSRFSFLSYLRLGVETSSSGPQQNMRGQEAEFSFFEPFSVHRFLWVGETAV
jgi:hypothetical protein